MDKINPSTDTQTPTWPSTMVGSQRVGQTGQCCAYSSDSHGIRVSRFFIVFPLLLRQTQCSHRALLTSPLRNYIATSWREEAQADLATPQTRGFINPEHIPPRRRILRTGSGVETTRANSWVRYCHGGACLFLLPRLVARPRMAGGAKASAC
ncbi:hypothetical protein BGZ61DRAFT_186136 [Ilyonectria robusta]|uniref:uncharacterized protein n=1 Tax=Ilyonectria robusta TaxID=1079257 RepID=UPI001E8E48DA|nr:uncharacterized protein BGZ61DRAFT_186136 [Ilyonectria robusta]KAH8729685.1 hypothetical protein BGZ61DRAFT_186136 [Ilyonectria robusta]